jgi:tetratricopeptide (TPR) repeat protein
MTVVARMLIALIVAGMLGIVFPASVQQDKAVLDVATLTFAVAFVVGIFPEDGLNWLISFVGRFIPMRSAFQHDQLQLQILAGLTNWHALRLSLEGIQNVQNLVSADIEVLRRRTRFGPQQIFDWMDQGLLALHVNQPEEFARLQQGGIRGFGDFQSTYLDDQTRPALAALLVCPPDGADDKQRARAEADGTRRARLMYTAMREAPGVDLVRWYWRYQGAYATGTFEPFNRGRVFLELGRCDDAIAQFNQALSKNTREINLYLSRGEAYQAKARHAEVAGDRQAADESVARALADYTEALRDDPLSSPAYRMRGNLYLLSGR